MGGKCDKVADLKNTNQVDFLIFGTLETNCFLKPIFEQMLKIIFFFWDNCSYIR